MTEVEFGSITENSTQWMISQIQTLNFNDVQDCVITYAPPAKMPSHRVKEHMNRLMKTLREMIPSHVKIILTTPELQFEFIKDPKTAYAEGKKVL